MALHRRLPIIFVHFRGMVVNPESRSSLELGQNIYMVFDPASWRCDKIYGIENPGYPKIAEIYDSMHVSYSAIDLDKWCLHRPLENHQIDIISTSFHPTIFQLVSSHRSAVVMNCLVGLLRMRTVISLKMIMTVNYALAENRSLHCKVLMSLIKSFI